MTPPNVKMGIQITVLIVKGRRVQVKFDLKVIFYGFSYYN